MSRNWVNRLLVLALTFLVLAGGMSGMAAAAEESDCGVEGCLDDPDDDQPKALPGGGVAFDTPVVDSTGVMPGDRVTLGDDFKTFLKAKKAFHEGRQSIQAIKKGAAEPEDVPTFFDDDDGS